jgi:hypothetical protein
LVIGSELEKQVGDSDHQALLRNTDVRTANNEYFERGLHIRTSGTADWNHVLAIHQFKPSDGGIRVPSVASSQSQPRLKERAGGATPHAMLPLSNLISNKFNSLKFSKMLK